MDLDDDDEVKELMATKGEGWWLAGGAGNWNAENGVKYLLPFLCHRHSKDISRTCSTQAAGQTRTQQRAQTAANIAARREEYRALQRDSLDEFQQQAKRMKFEVARVQIRSKQTDILSKQTENISNQLQLLERMKDIIVASKGVEFYNNKVVALIEQLPNPVANEDTLDSARQGAPEDVGRETRDDIPNDVLEEMAQESHPRHAGLAEE